MLGKRGQENSQIFLMIEVIFGLMVIGTLAYASYKYSTNYSLSERYTSRDLAMMMDTSYAAPGNLEITIPLNGDFKKVEIGKDGDFNYYRAIINEKTYGEFFFANDKKFGSKLEKNIVFEKPQAIKFLKEDSGLDVIETGFVPVNYAIKDVKAETEVQRKIVAAARQYRVPADVALSIAQQESNMQHTWSDGRVKISSAGAIGIMQILVSTAKGSCRMSKEDLYNIDNNIICGVRVIRSKCDRYKCDTSSKCVVHKSTGKTYCGWDIAIRGYVGWGSGHSDYVEEVNARKSSFIA